MVSGVASDATSASRLRPQRPSGFGEEPSLRVREPKTPGTEAPPEHAVLDPQKLDRMTLSTTEPAGDQQNQELKRRYGRHGHRTLPTQAAAANAIRPEYRAIEFGTVVMPGGYP